MAKDLTTKISELKSRISGLRGGPTVKLRLHRAVSWLQRGDAESDADATYIFLWIAFNAAYSAESNDRTDVQRRKSYLEALVPLDAEHHIDELLIGQLRLPVQDIMENVYLFRGFWDCLTEQPFNWQKWPNRSWFMRDQSFVVERLIPPAPRTLQAQLRPNWLIPTDVTAILRKLFDRLNVLRNQLMHGCATQDGSINRRQVDAGAMVLGPLVHVFLDIMVDNPNENWGSPAYPVRDDIREDRHQAKR